MQNNFKIPIQSVITLFNQWIPLKNYAKFKNGVSSHPWVNMYMGLSRSICNFKGCEKKKQKKVKESVERKVNILQIVMVSCVGECQAKSLKECPLIQCSNLSLLILSIRKTAGAL